MSGGYWNYSDRNCMNDIFGYFDDSEESIPNVFRDLEISNLVFDVFNLLHDYDWYMSGDTGKGTWLKKKAAFKEKWLNKDGAKRSARTCEIVDDAIEKLRDDLHDAFCVCGNNDVE